METKIIMGMPITVHVVDKEDRARDISDIFSYFEYVDEKFSTYKETSEISAINKNLITEKEYSSDMIEVLALSKQTSDLTSGYFNITRSDGKIDPSGLVKGWAIYNASFILKKRGLHNFFIDAGGDVQTSGKNDNGRNWQVGIRNPLKPEICEVVKIISGNDIAVATSGTYLRGEHIYDPVDKKIPDDGIISLTVIGPNIYEADRFATAAFAMGKKGILFIESLRGFEGYMIYKNGLAIETSGFSNYVEIHA